jgi:hypothetical protein
VKERALGRLGVLLRRRVEHGNLPLLPGRVIVPSFASA